MVQFKYAWLIDADQCKGNPGHQINTVYFKVTEANDGQDKT